MRVTSRTLCFCLTCLLVASVTGVGAEVATDDEMKTVCNNWLALVVHETGAWAGDTEPRIAGARDILGAKGLLLARCFDIAPKGYVVVPVLRELPPIKLYSDGRSLDVDQRDGLPELLREILQHRIDLFAQTYGSLSASQPASGEVLLGRNHRREWDRFAAKPDEFTDLLSAGAFGPMLDAGPLLTTSWAQGSPYNDLCPMGDGGQTVVGCVATAAAQVLKYHEWPPSGTGTHSYTWNGDQSCGGDVGGGLLSADFSDPYDWGHMPDSCDAGCSPAEEAALAELNYEVGVAFEMDYGRCGSGTWTFYALDALPAYFRYDPRIDGENREHHTAADWFAIIQTEIDAARPMLYRISRHAIVCDGWRTVSSLNQYHMNYGWGGSRTAWYTVDSLYCNWDGCDPMVEYVIRNIKPRVPADTRVWYIRPDGLGDAATIQAGIDSALAGDTLLLASGVYTGGGNRDIDYHGKSIVIRSVVNAPAACIIDCEASAGDPHRGFYFHSGEDSNAVLQGVTIRNGYLASANGGGVYCESGSSPTIRNCVFTDNTAANYGGGMMANQTSVFAYDCVFENNTVTVAGAQGGGLFCEASPVVVMNNCHFRDNRSPGGGGGAFFAGSDTSSIDITDCVFYENTTSGHGAGVGFADCSPSMTNSVVHDNHASGDGGGLYMVNSNAIVTDCEFSENAAIDGGGIFGDSTSSPFFVDCVIERNRADAMGGGARLAGGTMTGCVVESDSSGVEGAGLSVGDVTINTCVVTNTRSGTRGSGIHVRGGTVTIDGCTVAYNECPTEVAGIFIDGGANATITNSVVAYNGGPGSNAVGVRLGAGSVSMSCCDVYGNQGGEYAGMPDPTGTNGNLSQSPRFCDPVGGDLTVAAFSACLPVNNSCGVLMGALGEGCADPVPLTIAHWMFDEMSGDSLVDHSRHGHHGVLHGTQWESGCNGGALSFDGFDDYVIVPHSPGLAIDRGTIEIIFRPAGGFGEGDSSGTLMQKEAAGFSGGDLDIYLAGPEEDNGRLTVAAEDGSGRHYVRGDSTSWIDRWYHMAYVFDPTGMRVYVNRELQLDESTFPASWTNNNRDLVLGYGGSGEAFHGRIDEVRITEGVLSPEDFLWCSCIDTLLTLTTNTTGSGFVTRMPDQATYVCGDTVIVTAVPDTGWVFDGWSGALAGTDNPDTVVMVIDTTIAAAFVPDTLIITVTTNPPGLEVVVDSVTYTSPRHFMSTLGATHVISVDPKQVHQDSVFTFLSWSDGDSISHTIVVPDSSATYTANYIYDAPTGIGDPLIPEKVALYQNVPNPFNPTTVIRYDVSAGGARVSLRVFDVSGQLIRTLVDGNVTAGRKTAFWDGRDTRGNRVSSGVYFYRLQAGDRVFNRKMTFLK